MPLPQQVFSDLAAPGGLVDQRGQGAVRTLRFASGGDHGKRLGQRPRGLDAGLAELQHDHAADGLRQREVDCTHDRFVLIGRHDRYRDRHPRLLGRGLDTAERVRVAVARRRGLRDDRDQRRLAQPQRPCRAVRAVAELLHRRLDPQGQFWGNVLGPVEYAGDGGHRDTRRLRDIGEDGGAVRLRGGHGIEDTRRPIWTALGIDR